MHTKTLFALSLFISMNCAIGQSIKKTYFDENWNTSDKNNAHYYRETTKQTDKTYLVQDYYINGQMQMEGHYLDKKGRTQTGTFTYYDGGGSIEQITNYTDGKRDGIHAYYYENGVTRSTVSYSEGIEVGDYSEFYESGEIRAKATYVDGDLVGESSRFYPGGEPLMHISLDEMGSGTFKVYFQDGNLLEEGNFIEGLRDGVWHRYNRDGEIIDSTIYKELEKRDQFLEEQKAQSKKQKRWRNLEYSKSINSSFFNTRYVLDDDGANEVTYFPEVEAMFPGGTTAMRVYISENIVYPIKARKKNKESKIYVGFIVEIDGSISAIRILEGHRYFHETVIELVGNMPNWIPGQVNGVAVRARCRLPITFTLN